MTVMKILSVSLQAFALCAALVLGAGHSARAEGGALIMIHAKGCTACAKWEHEVGAVYAMTDEAQRLPLRRMDIAEARRADAGIFATPPYFTPTFVILDGGREVGRILGYSNDLSFWGLLQIELDKLDARALPTLARGTKD